MISDVLVDESAAIWMASIFPDFPFSCFAHLNGGGLPGAP